MLNRCSRRSGVNALRSAASFAACLAAAATALSSGSSSTAQGGYAGQWNQQAYGQQGYAQPGQQSYSQEQPIIQDGWQWDPQAQQWIPAQQQAPAPPAAPW